jgi:hypothetical protein
MPQTPIRSPKLTLGQRLVRRFPSQHRDPQKSSEQMRALSNLIDFILPQSKAEALLTLAGGPVIGKAIGKPLTVYRIAKKWYPGKMVRDGEFTGKAGEEIYTSLRKDVVDGYARALKHNAERRGKKVDPILLEFELPESWVRKNSREFLKEGWERGTAHEYRTNPIPKKYFKKLYKNEYE